MKLGIEMGVEYVIEMQPKDKTYTQLLVPQSVFCCQVADASSCPTEIILLDS